MGKRVEDDVITVTVNGKEESVEVPADVPLLWVLREELGLTGYQVRLWEIALWCLYGTRGWTGSKVLCDAGGCRSK